MLPCAFTEVTWIYMVKYSVYNEYNYILTSRQQVQQHYVSYEKPYRGEMGIQTYLPHQMKGYFMVRVTFWSM